MSPPPSPNLDRGKPYCDSLYRMRLLALSLFAFQLAAQTPKFEAASIRLSEAPLTAGTLCHSMKPGMENLQAVGISLNLLVIDAYELDADQFDLPDWGRNRLDVKVVMPPNTSTDTCRQMLRSLLGERFHLVTAVETRDL